MTIIKFEYIYYQVFIFYHHKRDSAAQVTALLIVSLIQCFLFLDLFVIARIIYEYSIPSEFNKYWFLPFIILFPIMNWVQYAMGKDRKELKKQLINKWKSEDVKTRTKNGWMIIILLILTIVIPILYGIFRQNIISEYGF